jgi:hypothetical protein
MDMGYTVFGQAPPDELVIFLPFAGWREITVDNENHIQDNEYDAWLRPGHRAIKIIFGPFVNRYRTRHPTIWLDWWMSNSLRNICEFLRSVRTKCSSLSVYGLERVKACRYDYENFMVDECNNPVWWDYREHPEKSYEPEELRDIVEYNLSSEHSSDLNGTVEEQTPIRYFTIEQYIESEPNDGLFDQELKPSTTRSRWVTSKYWSSLAAWKQALPLRELGEGSGRPLRQENNDRVLDTIE